MIIKDTIRRRAWPKLIGLTRSYTDDEDTVHQRNIITVSSPPRATKPTVPASATAGAAPLPGMNNKQSFRKGTAPQRVTNFGPDNDNENHENTNHKHSSNTNHTMTTSTCSSSRNSNNNSPTNLPGNSNTYSNTLSGTAFTGGPFDQHDTAATAAAAEDDANISLASFDSDTLFPSAVMACLDAAQIERDVTRCTWHLLTGGQRSRRRVMMNKHRKKISKILRCKQRRLGDLINLTLAMSEVDVQDTNTKDNQRLCYFQGYHDVASIFLAALGGASLKNNSSTPSQQQSNINQSDDSNSSNSAAAQAASVGLELSSKVLYQVSLSHFREPMNTNFLQLQTAMRMVLFPLLRIMDPEVHAHLYGCGMEPFFALSWLLTWFSHDIRDTTLVKRLFDFFLVCHPLMPMYLSVAMLCHPSNRQEILSTPCEFAELHSCLAGLPKNSSMVGWKYRVGDGYVSDDEEIGEDGGGESTSISLDSDMTSHGDQGSTTRGGGPSILSGNDGMMRRGDLILSEDHSHVVSMGIPAHVPFQELMDSAVAIMRRVPPRKLLSMVRRYFDPVQAEPMLKMYASISLFRPPPSWALARTAKADWVIKQRTRDRIREDRKTLGELRNRHNVKNDNTQSIKPSASSRKSKQDHEVEEIFTAEMVEKLSRRMKYPKAMVAQGFGPGVDEVSRRKKRRKILMVGGAATVAVIAIMIGVNMSYRKNNTLQQLQQQQNAAPHGSVSPMGSTQTREEVKSNVKAAGSAGMGKAQSTTAEHLHSENRTNKKSAPKQSTSNTADSQAKEVRAATKISAKSVTSSSPIPAVRKNDTTHSSLRVYLKEGLAARIQLLVRAVELLKASLANPALRENARKVLSQFKSQMARSIALLSETESRNELCKAIRNRASLAPRDVTRYTGEFLKFTFRHARDTLGGDDLEELELL